MGTVYEAEQERPRRIVALKIIKPELANRETVWRFEQGGESARASPTPSIAQIYEAGIADTGFGLHCFFAMEYVRGQTLRVYAPLAVGTETRPPRLRRLPTACRFGVEHRRESTDVLRAEFWDFRVEVYLAVTVLYRRGARIRK
jgi:hypothetical protein